MSLPKVVYKLKPWKGRIDKEDKISNQISTGGNYIAPKKDHKNISGKLSGKSTGGRITIKGKSKKKARVRLLVNSRKGGNPRRTELAVNSPKGRSQGSFFDMGKDTLEIKMIFKVKAKDQKSLHGYVLQFWQPIVSPLAGIRIVGNNAELVARTGGQAAMRSYKLGEWIKFHFQIRLGKDGYIKPLNTEDFLQSRNVTGDLTAGSQGHKVIEDTWRPKFGWYGSTEQDIEIQVKRFALKSL